MARFLMRRHTQLGHDLIGLRISEAWASAAPAKLLNFCRALSEYVCDGIKRLSFGDAVQAFTVRKPVQDYVTSCLEEDRQATAH